MGRQNNEATLARVLLLGLFAARTVALDEAGCGQYTRREFGLCKAFCNSRRCRDQFPEFISRNCELAYQRFTTITGDNPPCVRLTREMALGALIADENVSIDSDLAQVFSPFVDFGFGPGYEGLLPRDSLVEPALQRQPPISATGVTAEVDSYFFWIDDDLFSRFQHDTRFVLVDATAASPTVSNGGIIVSGQGWWPVITEPDGTETEFYSVDEERPIDQRPSSVNPFGLVFGFSISNLGRRTTQSDGHFLRSLQVSSLPSFTPGPTPGATPDATQEPSAMPSLAPSLDETLPPTPGPSRQPSHSPTDSATPEPSVMPSSAPSLDETLLPTPGPTMEPSQSPTDHATPEPSVMPSSAPSLDETLLPTPGPSREPSLPPTPATTPIPTPGPTPDPTTVTTKGDACGLILRGSRDKSFEQDVKQFEKDFKEVYKLDIDNRVVIIGKVSSLDDLRKAVDDLIDIHRKRPCSKIHVRITSHGTPHLTVPDLYFLQLNTQLIGTQSLGEQLKRIGKLKIDGRKVMICLVLASCHSTGLVPADFWGFAENSVIITSAAATGPGSRGKAGRDKGFFTLGASKEEKRGGLFELSYSMAIRETSADENKDGCVDCKEAFEWLEAEHKKGNVCWKLLGIDSPETMYYPMGLPDGVTRFGGWSKPKMVVVPKPQE